MGLSGNPLMGEEGANETAPERHYELRLYVAGQTPRSVEAFSNLKKICEEHLKGRYSIEVIDLLENPKLARGDQILAIYRPWSENSPSRFERSLETWLIPNVF